MFACTYTYDSYTSKFQSNYTTKLKICNLFKHWKLKIVWLWKMNRDGSPARHQTHLEPTLKKRFMKSCWENKIGIEFIFASKLFYSRYRNSFRHRSTQTLLVSHANRSAETPKFSAVENFQYAPIRILSTQHISTISKKLRIVFPDFQKKNITRFQIVHLHFHQ